MAKIDFSRTCAKTAPNRPSREEAEAGRAHPAALGGR